MEKICMRDTIVKMWKHKWIVLACIVVCAGIGAVIGYRNGQKEQAELSAEYEEMVRSAQAEYDANIATYDNNIKNQEIEVEKAQKQADSVGDYVNNAVYMKLDPANLYVYGKTVEVEPIEELDANAVAAKLGTYVTSGSVYSDLDEALDAKHWNDIVGVNVNGNDVYVTVTNVDENSAKVCVDALVDAMKNYAGTPVSVVNEDSYVRTDVNVGYNQNNHRNNYYSYEQNLNNQIKAKNDQEIAKAAYETSGVDAIIDAKVEEEDKVYEVSPTKKAFLAAIIGALAGLILPMAVLLIAGIINGDREDKKRAV